ncbi:competence protein CoiA family protein [Chitinimonas sp. BJB300]|uniref:competence protein CoiA family protein n=1 Tax=Chitinimonas sp. BJB300 TaxID=1559339 RepID=UPI001111B35C|nr:hypothetical protein FG002_019820 [Chitinimonas sp. BJB300]
MTPTTSLQHFAVNKEGQLVSVGEVERGLACECYCLACQSPSLARQGHIRTWHFAHAQETDCEYAAETALHKAAKECISRGMKLWVPAISVTEIAYSGDRDR